MKLFSRSDAPHECEWTARAHELEREIALLRERSPYEDPTTGLGNAQQFSRDATRLAAQHGRRPSPFAVVIVEVRCIRSPSTSLRGEALAALSGALLDTTRLEDSVSRLSEYRFGIVVANASREGALELTDRIRKRIGGIAVFRSDGSHYLELTAGVAEWEDRFQSIDELGSEALADLRRSQTLVRNPRVLPMGS